MSGPKSGRPEESDLIILRCPECGAGEPVKASMLASGPGLVHCRRCGNDWTARADLVPEGSLVDPRKQSVVWADAGAIDDIRKPLVGYAEDSDPWAAKRARSDQPMPPPASGAPLMPRLAVSALALAFLGGAVLARQAAVAAVPDLAGLYEVVGLDVNVVGLSFEQVSGARAVTGREVTLKVSGIVRNVTSEARDIPGIAIVLVNEAGQPIGEERIDPPVPSLGAGAAVRFVVDLKRTPREAASLRVRFAEPAPAQA